MQMPLMQPRLACACLSVRAKLQTATALLPDIRTLLVLALLDFDEKAGRPLLTYSYRLRLRTCSWT